MKKKKRLNTINNTIHCGVCDTYKSVDSFFKNKSRKDGLAPQCKDCEKVKQYTLSRRYGQYMQTTKDFKLSVKDFNDITMQPCHYCNSFVPGFTHSGIDRVDSKQGYTLSNCVPCCKVCNSMKLNHDLQFFYEHIQKILDNKNK